MSLILYTLMIRLICGAREENSKKHYLLILYIRHTHGILFTVLKYLKKLGL
jgi:hypothetical protein